MNTGNKNSGSAEDVSLDAIEPAVNDDEAIHAGHETPVLQLGFGVIDTAVIRVDGGTQTRAAIDDEVVEDYAEAMASGKALPPVVVFHDGTAYWLADGFHRLAAAIQAGKGTIAAEIRAGGRLDAVRHALGANHGHGLRRTNADQRRCVELALQYFNGQSDRALAELCGVGHQLVGEVRGDLAAPVSLTSDSKARWKVDLMPEEANLLSGSLPPET
jgi:uncharacterized ParB-like nuclease family protein